VGQRKQRQPAGRAERHHGGVLVVRRQVQRAQWPLLQRFLDGIDAHPVAVDGQRHQRGACTAQRKPCGRVAQSLHAHPVAWRQQRVRGQPDGLLTAARDQHVVRLGGQTTRGAEHASQRNAQRLRAERRAVIQPARTVAQDGAAVGLGQHGARKQPRVGRAAGQEQRLVIELHPERGWCGRQGVARTCGNGRAQCHAR